MLRIANIGLPGAQPVPLFEPYPGPPVTKLVQPSLGAADWFGFTQETSIQLPAYAELAASHPPARTSASVKATSSARLACPFSCLFIVASISCPGPVLVGFGGL